MSNSKKASVLVASAAALTTAAVMVGVQPVSAALTTRCVGVAEAVNVPGDLVVPAGRSCALYGTTIAGSVRVREGADLLLFDGATIGGDLRLAPDAYVEMSGSTLDGSLVGDAPYGVFARAAGIAGNVRINANRAFEGIPFLVTDDADVGGSIRSATGEVVLESTVVGGAVRTSNGGYTDVVDSTINGDLAVAGNELGAVVCESEIYGNATYSGNLYGLQIGGDGGLGSCEGPSFWGGDVTISDNQGAVVGIDVSNNIVRGSLSGDGNDPAPTGAGNRVRGGAGGQFTDLQPRSDAPPEVAAVPDVASRTATAEVEAPGASDEVASRSAIDAEVDARRTQAAADARAAGPADLVP